MAPPEHHVSTDSREETILSRDYAKYLPRVSRMLFGTGHFFLRKEKACFTRKEKFSAISRVFDAARANFIVKSLRFFCALPLKGYLLLEYFYFENALSTDSVSVGSRARGVGETCFRRGRRVQRCKVNLL
jgi:hypothetical protein